MEFEHVDKGIQETSAELGKSKTKEAELSELISRGIADAKAGDFASAIDEYKKALSRDSHCVPASINLGLAFKNGDFQDAIPPLEYALREDFPRFACCSYACRRAI